MSSSLTYYGRDPHRFFKIEKAEVSDAKGEIKNPKEEVKR
jgi:hypothetical protein